MTVLPMSTQQWQDQRFGPSLKRSMKWFSVDVFGVATVIRQRLEPAFTDFANAAVDLAALLAAVDLAALLAAPAPADPEED